MTPETELGDVKATLGEVAAMLDEMAAGLRGLSEDQVHWVPPGEDVWPILRAVTHCVNCEHRAAVELGRALAGHATPETVKADTAIFAWHGPTPYALARLVKELRERVAALSAALGPEHLAVEAVRYPTHPPRALPAYVERMRMHTARHLAGIRKKLAVMPPGQAWDEEVRAVYPDYARGAGERGG